MCMQQVPTINKMLIAKEVAPPAKRSAFSLSSLFRTYLLLLHVLAVFPQLACMSFEFLALYFSYIDFLT